MLLTRIYKGDTEYCKIYKGTTLLYDLCVAKTEFLSTSHSIGGELKFIAGSAVEVSHNGGGSWGSYVGDGSSLTASTTSLLIKMTAPSTIKFTGGASATISGVSVTDATMFVNFFESFKDLSDLTSFAITGTTDHITNINSMFYNCSSLETVPLFNTSGVTTFDSTFRNCALSGVSLYDLSNAIDIDNFLNGCSSLTSIPLFNTSGVTSCQGFVGGTAITTFPSGIDLTNVTLGGYIFNGCSSLTTVPTLNMPLNTNWSQMFQNCTSLVTSPSVVSIAGTGFIGMYKGCTSLTTVPSLNISGATTVGHTTIGGFFEDCNSVVTITLIQASGCTNYSRAFKGCTLLETITCLDTTAVTSSSDVVDMFTDCPALTSPTSGEQTSLTTIPPGAVVC